MLVLVCRFFLTIIYGLIGFQLALPLSYFFQNSLYDEMSFSDYVDGGLSSVAIGASFGAYDVYRTTAIFSIIFIIIIGKWLEHQILKRKTLR